MFVYNQLCITVQCFQEITGRGHMTRDISKISITLHPSQEYFMERLPFATPELKKFNFNPKSRKIINNVILEISVKHILNIFN